MALPPSKLKDLLSTCAGPDQIFERLVQAKCLVRNALEDRNGVTTLVAQAEHAMNERYAGDADACGPDRIDFVCRSLEAAGVLNRRGKRMAEESA